MLGGLLLLALLALLILIHKHYGPQLPCCSGKALVRPGEGWGRTGEAETRGRDVRVRAATGSGEVEKRQGGDQESAGELESKSEEV